VATRKVFEPNKNPCSHCKRVILPEPIVFAKMCRLTAEYVCDGCYSDSLYAIMEMEDARR